MDHVYDHTHLQLACISWNLIHIQNRALTTYLQLSSGVLAKASVCSQYSFTFIHIICVGSRKLVPANCSIFLTQCVQLVKALVSSGVTGHARASDPYMLLHAHVLM
jgi:hypothetical protein